MGGDMLAR
jgi:hypothetical protein